MQKKSTKFNKKVRNKNRFLTLEWRSTWGLAVLTIPAIIWFVIFSYIPMFGLVIAFKDFDYRKGIFGSDWCGLDNFNYLFASNDASRILRNTVCYNFVFIVLGIVLGVFFALLLERLNKRSMVKLYQTMTFLPHFVSWVVVAFIVQGIFKYDNGILNGILKTFGKEPMQWYTTVKPWPIVLVLANIWKTIGFNMLLYYGGLLGIDTTLYEAAQVDGATTLQRIFKITLPMLKPTILTLFIMNIGNMLRADFGLFYFVPNDSGALYGVTDVLDTYIYRALKISGEIPASSAASFFQSVVGLILVLIANGITRKLDAENAMF